MLGACDQQVSRGEYESRDSPTFVRSAVKYTQGAIAVVTGAPCIIRHHRSRRGRSQAVSSSSRRLMVYGGSFVQASVCEYISPLLPHQRLRHVGCQRFLRMSVNGH